MSDVDWLPEPHPIRPELNRAEFHAEPYTPPPARTWATVADQLDVTMRDRLRDLYGAR